ncbi:MAG: MFS transporter [Candidatus Rokubacteria bacterium]|nr:MFS transporter [Candidatus Rokubacteria bacterium]
MRERAGYWSVGVTFVTLALAYGVWYSYSLFFVALLHEFGWSRSLLAGAFSVFALAHGCLSPALGWLSDRVGPRRLVVAGGLIFGLALVADGAISRPWHLYLTFGILTAVGAAAAGWVPAVVLVQRWFPERPGFTFGIASSGIGVGIFLVVPLCQVLIEWLGWRWAFRTVGGLALLWVIPATLALVRDPPTGRATATPSGGDDSSPWAASLATAAGSAGPRERTLQAAARTLPFWLFAGALFLGSFCTQTLLIHQAAYLVDHEIPALMAALVVSVVGLSSIVSKTGGGWLSDRLPREVVYTLGMGCVVSSVGALGLIAIAPVAILAYAYGVLVGLGYPVTASLMPAVVGDHFRGRHFGSIFGTLQLFSALGGSAGPWVAGRLFDLTGSYRAAFLAAVCAAVAATVALWLARRRPCPW